MATKPPNLQFGAPPMREADVAHRVLALVAERLPPGWSIDVASEAGVAGGLIDAIAEIVGPGREKTVLAVEAKRSAVTRDLPAVAAQLQSYLKQITGPVVPMLAARYLSPSAWTWLEEHDISYGDATGNLRIVTAQPALFLRDTGASHDPWRGPGRPRGTLHGQPAARVVRALADYASPITVLDLVRRSGASTGATYRVVEFLEGEGMIERGPRGSVQQVHWRRMLERWSQDYGFQRSNGVTGYLHPRGLDAIRRELASTHDLRYVITGSLAAERLAPYAPPRLAMIYADDPAQAASQIGLRAIDAGVNVLIAAPKYDVVYERLVKYDGLRFAAPSQTAVDLLTAPGRGPSEGTALLDWMEGHEHEWRH